MRPACRESCPLASPALAGRPAAVFPHAHGQDPAARRGRSLTSHAGPGPSVRSRPATAATLDPVTAAAHPARACWRVLLLAALAVVLALLLPSVPASAAALPAAETRVGASGPATAVAVGVHECITAGSASGSRSVAAAGRGGQLCCRRSRQQSLERCERRPPQSAPAPDRRVRRGRRQGTSERPDPLLRFPRPCR